MQCCILTTYTYQCGQYIYGKLLCNNIFNKVLNFLLVIVLLIIFQFCIIITDLYIDITCISDIYD